MHENLRERFESFVMPEPNSGCYLWMGNSLRWGYGRFHHGGKRPLAHRFAWELNRGPIPAGIHVLHRCDNPSCVNVDHLYLGTHRDNMADIAKRCRGRTGRLPYGVRKQRRGGYQSRIRVAGALRSLGTFPTAEEAHRVALAEYERVYGHPRPVLRKPGR